MVSKTLCQLICIAIFVHRISAVCDDPLRVRRAWHSDEAATDRELYINGFKELSNQGKIQQFTLQHADDDARAQAHGGSGFLPWHRYFIWELESQIRALGGEYECFSLPYWDWAYDSTFNPDSVSDFDILNSGLGGNGDSTDDWCITDNSPFSKANGFEPVRDCPPQNNDGNCCLKRNAATNTDIFGDATFFAELIANHPAYADFRPLLEDDHGWAHVYIGGGQGHLRDPRYSPDDPIFFLIHAFVDYVWALWQDCYNYELLTREQAANTPAAYSGSGANTWPSDPLNFDVLAENSWTKILPSGVVLKNEGNQNLQILAVDSYLDIMSMHHVQAWNYRYVHDYLYDAITVWFVDTGIVSCSNLDGVLSPDRGRGPRFADLVWTELTAGLNLANATISRATSESLFKSLARINCEMRQSRGGREPCKRPKCFDDCSDLVPCEGDSGKDINVTLDELIEKVQGYPCMMETRRRFYNWAKLNGDLLGLCRGDYDNFCDRYDIQGESALDSCPVSEGYAEAVLEEYDDLESEEDDSYRSGRGGGKKGGRGREYGAHSGLFEIDNHNGFGVDNEGFKFDYNTLIIAVVIVFNVIGCFYLDNKWKRKLKKEGMKYIDQDDI